MRSHRRRAPVEHVLLAGTVEDLDDICIALSLLSPGAYGQVFVEAARQARLPFIAVPPRVSILRVQPGAAPGATLSRAVAGWIEEWEPEEPVADRRLSIWVGAHASAHVEAQCVGLGGLIERL